MVGWWEGHPACKKSGFKTPWDIVIAGYCHWRVTAQSTLCLQRVLACPCEYTRDKDDRTCVTNYVDLQTLKADDDCIQPHQHLWMFDVLVCPLSVTEHFLSQLLICVTIFHRMTLLSPLSPSSALVLNLIPSHFLIPLSDFSHLYSACAVTCHFGHWLFLHLTFWRLRTKGATGK